MDGEATARKKLFLRKSLTFGGHTPRQSAPVHKSARGDLHVANYFHPRRIAAATATFAKEELTPVYEKAATIRRQSSANHIATISLSPASHCGVKALVSMVDEFAITFQLAQSFG